MRSIFQDIWKKYLKVSVSYTCVLKILYNKSHSESSHIHLYIYIFNFLLKWNTDSVQTSNVQVNELLHVYSTSIWHLKYT